MRRIAAIALALGLALAQFRLIAFVFGSQLGRSMEAARGVVDGHPHWRIYQSRVLAPYALEGLARVFHSYAAGYVFFCVVFLTVAGCRVQGLGRRIDERHGAVLALAVLHLAFALLLSRPWLYAWDFVNLLVFLRFVDFVWQERRWPWFVLLFGLAIFNHEIAMFIPLWMILDPILRRRFDWRPIAAGAGCLVAGFAIVEGLRRTLLVEQVGPRLFGDAPPEMGNSLYFSLGKNLQWLGQMFTQWDYSLPFLVLIFIIVAIAVAVWLWRREPVRLGALALVHLVLIASLLLFGALIETRIYVPLIPMFVLAAVYATRRRSV